MTKLEKRSFYSEIIFVFFMFIFFVCWAIVQPFNSAPDEEMRYQICQYIFNNGCLPHGGDPSLRNPIWGISYGFTPILSYIISGFFMKITSIFSYNPTVLLFSARLVSILCSTGTVIMAIKTNKKLFSGKNNWIFIILVSLLPQFVFISSYVNTDSLAIFSTTLIIYSWLLGLEHDWRMKDCLFLGISLSICALSYYNAYGFILCSMFVFPISQLIAKTGSKKYSIIFKKCCFVSAVVILLCGWWFLRNYLIYDGDILGLKTSNHYSEMYAIDQYKPSQIQTPLHNNISLFCMLFKMGWLNVTYMSFIGIFGYMNILIYPWMYYIYSLIFIIGIIGCLCYFKKIFFFKKSDSLSKKKSLFNIVMFISAIIPNILNIIYSYTCDFEPQGRYSLPMLIPFMYFISTGINNILNKLIKNTKLFKVTRYTICLVCILISILCFTNIIVPKYCN